MTLQEQVKQAAGLGFSPASMRQHLLDNIGVAERMVALFEQNGGRSIYGPQYVASWSSQLNAAKRLLAEFDATY